MVNAQGHLPRLPVALGAGLHPTVLDFELELLGLLHHNAQHTTHNTPGAQKSAHTAEGADLRRRRVRADGAGQAGRGELLLHGHRQDQQHDRPEGRRGSKEEQVQEQEQEQEQQEQQQQEQQEQQQAQEQEQEQQQQQDGG